MYTLHTIRIHFADTMKLESDILHVMKHSRLLIVSTVLLALAIVYLLSTTIATVGFGFKEAVTHSPPTNGSNFELGEYYFNTHGSIDGPYDRTLARHYYQKAIREGEDHPLLWHQLGRLDFLDGDYWSAVDRLNTQIELHGDAIPNVYYNLGLVYGFIASSTQSEHDWNSAAEYFEKFLTYEPDNPWARTDLSWILFELETDDQMIPVLEIGLETNPDHPWLLNMYGLALMNTGHADKAVPVFEHALHEAKKLSVADWGRAYPGNSPDSWESRLQQFVITIEKNLQISKVRSLAHEQE